MSKLDNSLREKIKDEIIRQLTASLDKVVVETCPLP